MIVAAKRRKNAARGASRGRKQEINKPQRAERRFITPTANERIKCKSKNSLC